MGAFQQARRIYMLADFGFRARHITTGRIGSQWFGSAGVPPAILNLGGPAKNRRQDAGAANLKPAIFAKEISSVLKLSRVLAV